MSNTNTELVPYPKERITAITNADNSINVSEYLKGEYTRTVSPKIDIVQFGAYVFSHAYNKAASDLFDYVNNHLVAFMQTSNQTYRQALEVLSIYGNQVRQDFNSGIQTIVDSQRQELANMKSIIEASYSAQAVAIINTKDQIIENLKKQVEVLNAELQASTQEIRRLNQQMTASVVSAKDQVIESYKQQIERSEGAGYLRGKLESTESRVSEQSGTIGALKERVKWLEEEITTVRKEKETRIKEVEGQLEESKKNYNILYQQAIAFRESAQGTLDEANKMYNDKRTEVNRLKKKIGELEAQQKSIEEKYKKEFEEKNTTESTVDNIKLEIDNEKYVRIDKNIIKNPAITMRDDFFMKYKYFGFIYPMGTKKILAYYNEKNNMVTEFIGGLAFDGIKPNGKVIEDAELVIFENRKIE